MSPRRRRAFVLLSLALACGGLAASEVRSRVREVEAAVGEPVPVVVAARDVAPGAEVKPGDLAVREVPGRFAPPDAMSVPEEAVGAPLGSGLMKGSYVTIGALAAGQGGGRGRAPGPLRPGERALEVAVAVGDSLAEVAGPGSRVDVLISTDPGQGPGRSLLALESVELLDLSGLGASPELDAAEAGTGAGTTSSATSVATLRVTVRQAVYLTAAQNFAREVRLLVRPTGDRGRAGRAAVTAGEL